MKVISKIVSVYQLYETKKITSSELLILINKELERIEYIPDKTRIEFFEDMFIAKSITSEELVKEILKAILINNR